MGFYRGSMEHVSACGRLTHEKVLKVQWSHLQCREIYSPG